MLKETYAPALTRLKSETFKGEHPMFRYQVDAPPQDFYDRLSKAREIVVVGMGGSVLPLKSLVCGAGLQQKIFFWDSVDPESWYRELHDPVFCLVSKSGTTLEVAAMAAWILKHYPEEEILAVSDSESPLHLWAKKKGIPFCPIPKDIGGRFTNFTSFHAAVLEACGIDFESLLSVAREECAALKTNSEPLEALYSQIFETEKQSLILWSYGERSYGFALWLQQAIAESLGKRDASGRRHGLLPTVLRGPQDQHSVLQLLRDGPPRNVFWFLESWSRKGEDLHWETGLGNLHSKKLPDIMNILAESTYRSFEERVSEADSFQPVIRWQWDSELQDLVRATVRAQAFVEYAGKKLGINAFNQPGVERGKQIARELLV